MYNFPELNWRLSEVEKDRVELEFKKKASSFKKNMEAIYNALYGSGDELSTYIRGALTRLPGFQNGKDLLKESLKIVEKLGGEVMSITPERHVSSEDPEEKRLLYLAELCRNSTTQSFFSEGRLIESTISLFDYGSDKILILKISKDKVFEYIITGESLNRWTIFRSSEQSFDKDFSVESYVTIEKYLKDILVVADTIRKEYKALKKKIKKIEKKNQALRIKLRDKVFNWEFREEEGTLNADIEGYDGLYDNKVREILTKDEFGAIEDVFFEDDVEKYFNNEVLIKKQVTHLP